MLLSSPSPLDLFYKVARLLFDLRAEEQRTGMRVVLREGSVDALIPTTVSASGCLNRIISATPFSLLFQSLVSRLRGGTCFSA